MADRPENLDPAPGDFNDWLNATNAQGVTMREARLAQILEEEDPTLFLDLLANELSFAFEGPDSEGVYQVQYVRKATGAVESEMSVHWRKLLEGAPPASP
jgi:hypothetical protein